MQSDQDNGDDSRPIDQQQHVREKDEGGDNKEEEEVEAEDDLYGPDNEEYMNTPLVSPFPVPNDPPPPGITRRFASRSRPNFNQNDRFQGSDTIRVENIPNSVDERQVAHFFSKYLGRPPNPMHVVRLLLLAALTLGGIGQGESSAADCVKASLMFSLQTRELQLMPSTE